MFCATYYFLGLKYCVFKLRQVRLTDKKSGDILTPGSLEDLRGAINALFDVFVAITEHTQEYNCNFNHSDVLKQLQDVVSGN